MLDSAWLSPEEAMTPEMLEYILTEKQYGIDLAENVLEYVEKAIPLIADTVLANRLYHTFNRTLIFAKERKAVAQAVFGYRLWCKGVEFQTPALQNLIWEGLAEAEAMLAAIKAYPVHTPLGQWRWHRDQEAFSVYQQKITSGNWADLGLKPTVLPK